MKIIVISECVDARTGRRLLPGEEFKGGDPVQLERLAKAGCLVGEDDPRARAAVNARSVRDVGIVRARDDAQRQDASRAQGLSAEAARLNDEIAMLDKRRGEAESAAELAETRRFEAEEAAQKAEARRQQHEAAVGEAEQRRAAIERAAADAETAAAAAEAARKAKKA